MAGLVRLKVNSQLSRRACLAGHCSTAAVHIPRQHAAAFPDRPLPLETRLRSKYVLRAGRNWFEQKKESRDAATQEERADLWMAAHNRNGHGPERLCGGAAGY